MLELALNPLMHGSRQVLAMQDLASLAALLHNHRAAKAVRCRLHCIHVQMGSLDQYYWVHAVTRNHCCGSAAHASRSCLDSCEHAPDACPLPMCLSSLAMHVQHVLRLLPSRISPVPASKTMPILSPFADVRAGAVCSANGKSKHV